MKVGIINNYQPACVSFKAQIGDTDFLRDGVRYWGHNGTIEQKTLLLNYLNQIKQDKSMEKVYFYKKEDIYKDEVAYYAKINKGDKFEPELITGPYSRSHEKIKTGPYEYSNAQDIKNFIHILGYFIENHYGKEVFEQLGKQEPEYVKDYHVVQQKTDNQLQIGLRNTLGFKPLNYDTVGGGTIIPTDNLGLPLKEIYIC